MYGKKKRCRNVIYEDGELYILGKYVRKHFFPKEKVSFSKIAVAVITLFCMGCVTANYILAFRDAVNVNESVTICLIGTILGTVVAYLVKSAFENGKKIGKEKKED